MTMLDELRTLLQSNGADLVGIADLNEVPPDFRGGYPIGISIAVALNPRIIAGITEGPTKKYDEEYERVNQRLDMLGHLTAKYLTQRGHNAMFKAIADITADPNKLSTLLPHKTVATRAGLGWIGKCALLINKKFGSAIRLTSVVSDVVFPTSEPVNTSFCGKCTDCVEVCPSHAPSGQSWTVGIYRDSFFDAHACRKNAREMTLTRIGIQKSICGMCIAICPWTLKYIEK